MLREVEALRNGWTHASARAKAVKLNGWEWLYVVVCVLFAAVTWHYGALHFPTKASDDSYWTSQAQMQYPDVARYEEDQFCVKLRRAACERVAALRLRPRTAAASPARLRGHPPRRQEVRRARTRLTTGKRPWRVFVLLAVRVYLAVLVGVSHRVGDARLPAAARVRALVRRWRPATRWRPCQHWRSSEKCSCGAPTRRRSARESDPG